MTSRPAALVTGCSSGFGPRIARTLAEAGHHVFATMRDVQGRNAAAAEELRAWAREADRSLEVLELDVTSDASVARAAEEALARAGRMDVVVANARELALGVAESFDADDVARVFDVNVGGVLRVANAFLPAMREQGSGLVVGISSIMGRVVLPFAAPYTASKWAVEGLLETMRYELAPLGVDVSIVEPGAYPTEIASKGVAPSRPETLDGYGPVREMMQAWLGGFEKMFEGPDVPDPQDVADAVARLAATEPGRRPLRVVVDRFTPAAAESLNRASESVQRELFEGFGLSAMLSRKT